MSAQLERIIAEGTSVDYRQDETAASYRERRKAKPSNAIKCADGFSLSVIAGMWVYSSPRDVETGPFAAVEVGYPSERPEPWDAWAEYCENPEDPTSTVYGYVPVDLVRALVESHGGAA